MPTPRTAHPLKPAQDITILIVDDIPDNLRLITRILEPRGYVVRKALNGRMALQSVRRTPPNLILLDINMPEMSGYEVCQTLKSAPETAQIPVIFISALDHIQDKVRAFDLGGADYITKPFQEQEVLIRVQNQLLIQQQYEALEQQRQELVAKNQQLEIEIKERHKAEAEIRRLSLTDELTNLLNRRGFLLMANQQLKVSRRAQTPCGLMFADVDNLKTINDQLGHAMGDQLIANAGDILRNCFREEDIIARLGGDEFVALLLIDESHHLDVSQRLAHHIAHFNHTHQNPYQVSLSFGLIPCTLDHPTPLTDLIAQADALMYQQKKLKKAAASEHPTA